MHFNIKTINGNYITIHQNNDFYEHITEMFLEHFDIPEYSNTVFSVGTYIRLPYKELQRIFPNKRIIIYQLEQLMNLTTWQSVPNIIENIKDAEEIWDYDYLNSHYLKNNCNISVKRLLPVLFTKKLDKIESKIDPEIDVLFYGFINQRRFKIFEKLQQNLYGKIKLAWIYGTLNLENYIANSKVILNLHAAEPWNRQEQVRMFYPVINGKTVVSEVSQLNNMPGEIIETDLEKLSETLIETCQSNKWRTFGLQAKEKFKERTRTFLQKEFNIELKI